MILYPTKDTPMTTKNFCTQCGSQFTTETAFCTSCGTPRTLATAATLATASAAGPPAPPASPHVAPTPGSATPYGVAPQAVRRASAQIGGGKLLASGVLSIITGSVYLLMAIMTLSMKDTIFGDMLDDATGVLTLMLLIFLALGGGFIAVGVGACKVRTWAQMGTLALGGVSLLFFLIVLISTGEASILVPLLWFGVIVGLAVAVKPQTLGQMAVQHK